MGLPGRGVPFAFPVPVPVTIDKPAPSGYLKPAYLLKPITVLNQRAKMAANLRHITEQVFVESGGGCLGNEDLPPVRKFRFEPVALIRGSEYEIFCDIGKRS